MKCYTIDDIIDLFQTIGKRIYYVNGCKEIEVLKDEKRVKFLDTDSSIGTVTAPGVQDMK